MNQIFIRALNLPGSVRGATVPIPGDDFVVFVNSNHCPDTQQKTIRHELIHIKRDHFYHDDPVIINELEAEGAV